LYPLLKQKQHLLCVEFILHEDFIIRHQFEGLLLDIENI